MQAYLLPIQHDIEVGQSFCNQGTWYYVLLELCICLCFYFPVVLLVIVELYLKSPFTNLFLLFWSGCSLIISRIICSAISRSLKLLSLLIPCSLCSLRF